MQLYTFFLSSASYRARIGLNLKGLAYESVFVNLVSGEQLGDEYLALNPEGRVPFLTDGDVRLSQALAILEYLDERYPEPPILPRDVGVRACDRLRWPWSPTSSHSRTRVRSSTCKKTSA